MTSHLKIIPSTGTNSGSVQQLWDTLQKEGTVVSNSPKNRARLYKRLEKAGILFRTEVIGYTNGGRNLGRYRESGRAISWDLGRIVKWISAKRIIAEEIYEYCKDNQELFPWDPVKEAFCDPHMSNHERYERIHEAWGYSLSLIKWTPFDSVILHKTVVQITLLAT